MFRRRKIAQSAPPACRRLSAVATRGGGQQRRKIQHTMARTCRTDPNDRYKLGLTSSGPLRICLSQDSMVSGASFVKSIALSPPAPPLDLPPPLTSAGAPPPGRPRFPPAGLSLTDARDFATSACCSRGLACFCARPKWPDRISPSACRYDQSLYNRCQAISVHIVPVSVLYRARLYLHALVCDATLRELEGGLSL